MHLHKYEKYWLTLGIATLVAFLIIVGVGAFHEGTHPPSAKKNNRLRKGCYNSPVR